MSDLTGRTRYDEERVLPSPWEWVIITVFSLSIAGFGIVVYLLVEDGPRQWDFGQLPDTPAESIYSTERPGKVEPTERQLPLLPEARPDLPPKPRGQQQKERSPAR